MVRCVVLLALTAAPVAALAQTTPQVQALGQPQGSSRHGVAVAPRDPSGQSAGATTANQPKMDQTVQQIDNKLLNQEKDRPRLPDQTPSPSQTMPGGTASGSTASGG